MYVDLEPRRLREERVDTFIDLGATSVDHEEVCEVPVILAIRMSHFVHLRRATRRISPCKLGNSEPYCHSFANSTSIQHDYWIPHCECVITQKPGYMLTRIPEVVRQRSADGQIAVMR